MNAIEQAIAKVAEVRDIFQIAALDAQLAACRELEGRGEFLDVVVLGSFKTGKSSLLNSLARRDVLPVGVLPVTAVITRLSFAEKESATVVFLDGRRESVSLDAIAAYISESQNPNNAKRVAAVLVELPTMRDYDGLRFIDTPGLGSIFAHNTETTLQWMPRIGAALLATSADHPFSERDAALLKDVLRFTPKVSVLLTKSDLLTTEQVGEVSNFIAQQVKTFSDEPIPIFTYSIKTENAAHRERLDNSLLRPLARGKSEEHARILRHKVKHLLTESIEYLGIGLAAAEQEESKRAQLREQVLSEKTDFASTREELRLLERDCSLQTQAWIYDALKRHEEEICKKLEAEFQSQLPQWKLNLWKFARKFEQWMDDALAREMRAVSQLEFESLRAPLLKAQPRFARAVDNFRQRLAHNLEQTLGVTMERPKWECEIAEPQQPDVSVSSSFDIHIDLIWFLIPMTVFGSLIQRNFARKIPWEVQKNLSRLAMQWTQQVNRRIHELEQQAESFVKTEIETMEKLLAQQPSTKAAMERARIELADARERLETRS